MTSNVPHLYQFIPPTGLCFILICITTTLVTVVFVHYDFFDFFNLSPDHVIKSHAWVLFQRSLKIKFAYSFLFETLVDNIKS